MTVSELGTEVAGHGPEPEGAGARTAVVGRTPLQLAWRRLRKDRAALISIFVIVFLILVALLAHPLSNLIGQNPYDQDLNPATGLFNGISTGPTSTHLLGVDNVGRDVLSRLMYGAQSSLLIGLVATAIQIVLGIVVGIVAGFYGGVIDVVLSRLMDILLAFPVIIVGLALVARFGASTIETILLIAIFGWSSLARIVRGQVLALREREFVEAARSLGSSDLRIMFVDILPNLIAPVIVYGTLLIPVNIVFESTLSFLGLGVQPPKASWGQMLGDASETYQHAWWFLVFPALALLATTLSFNILGDGLRDAFDPRYDRTVAK